MEESRIEGTQVSEEVWHKSRKVLRESLIQRIMMMFVFSRREIRCKFHKTGDCDSLAYKTQMWSHREMAEVSG